MCLTLLGGGGGSRPSQTMSDFWPDMFLETAPYGLGTRLAILGREHSSFDPLTLIERVAAIVPGESEPWPGFRGKGDSGVPQLKQTNNRVYL